jgi:ureidoglycolate dehydrogenase (NAD+)
MSDVLDENMTRVNSDELRILVVKILRVARFRKEDADVVADVLLWADFRGHGSHGVGRLSKYLDFIRRGDLDPEAIPTLAKNVGSLIHVDGHRASGAIAASLGAREAIAGARRHGSAWAIIGDATHAGAIGYYMEAIARNGMIGLGFASGPPLMAYEGTSVATVSTAPMSIGLPTRKKPAFILDMATSVVANGKIQRASRNKSEIPLGWGLDKTGRSTTDPKSVTCLLPLGGAKGSGLALAFEAICSLSAGAPILQAALNTGKTRNMQSLALCAIDIGQLRDLEIFRAEVDDLLDSIKRQPRREGVEEILIPGERSARHAESALRDGVSVETEVLRELQRLAGADSGDR